MANKTAKIIFTGLLSMVFLVPSVASASMLTSGQVDAIMGLLRAFNLDTVLIAQVKQTLTASLVTVAQSATPAEPPSPRILPTDSVYPSSNIGYDLSYATFTYPDARFNFGIVGVSGGKAFVHNSRFAQEYAWTKFGAGRPSLYMNLNAPYGSKVAGHVNTPKSCPTNTGAEPTACEGYNFGYNAAQDALAYAKSNGATSPIWWIDIEEANSWSPDVVVNDATIQGAIDYFNAQNIRVGTYSVARMWRNIAGTGFVPTQTIGGQAVSIPAWLPIGISDLVSAANACVTDRSFMPGGAVWLLQYEASSTAIDQLYAC